MSAQSNEKNNNSKFIIIGVIAVLVLLGIFFLMRGSDTPEPVIVEEPVIEEIPMPEPEPVQEEIFVPEPEPVIEEAPKPVTVQPPRRKPSTPQPIILSEEEQAKVAEQEKRNEQRKFINSLKSSPTQVVTSNSGVFVDQIITPSFVENMAFYLVENYTPPAADRRTGEINVSPEMINTHYGIGLTGLPGSGNAYYVREILLDFVYQPTNFSTLYLVYSQKTIDEMLRASSMPSNSRPAFTVAQQEAMLFDYAQYFFSAGHSVQTILNMPNLEQIFATKNDLETNLVKNRTRFVEVQTSFEQARMDEDVTAADMLKEEMLLLADFIGADQAALQELQDQVIFAHGTTDKQVFPRSDVIYIFGWLGRRHAQNPDTFYEVSRDLEDAAFKLSADFVTKAKLLQ